jgi:hypothetical protein
VRHNGVLRGSSNQTPLGLSGGIRDAHFNVQTGGADHIDQGIEAKQFDLAAQSLPLFGSSFPFSFLDPFSFGEVGYWPVSERSGLF